ncbi:MAG: hypothetical protein ACJ8C8_16640, partial [Microvirga sp.]
GKPLLESVPGVWVRVRTQVVVSFRREPEVPSGRVDVLQAHVIDSRLNRSSRDAVPGPNIRWRAFDRETPPLDSSVIDEDLNRNILDALTLRLKGTFTDMS